MSIPPVPGNACDISAKLVRKSEEDVKFDQDQIRILRNRLVNAQSQPNPDQSQIAEIKADIQMWEEELKQDRIDLDQSIEDYEIECGNWPPAN